MFDIKLLHSLLDGSFSLSALCSLGLLKANMGLSVGALNEIGFVGADGAEVAFAVNVNTGVGSACGLPVCQSA